MLEAVLRARSRAGRRVAGRRPGRVRGRPLVSFTVEWPPNSTTTPSSASSGRLRRRDQARVPQARPAVAPRRQHGPGGAGAVQGDQRGLPGAVRPGAPPGATTCSAGRGRWPGEGTSGSVRVRWVQRHLRRVLRRCDGHLGAARPAADRRRPALRPPDHVRGGGPRDGEGDRVPGPRHVRDVQRQRRQARDAADRPARSATAAARSAPSARRCSARWSTSRPARAAGARARSSRRPATPATARAASSASARSGSRSRRASTRATRSASRTRARSGRAAARRAASTSRSTSARTRRSSARAPSCTTRPTSRSPRPRSGRRSSCRPSRATRRSRSRPAPSPAPRSGCAAGACRTCAGPACAATSTSWSTSSSRPKLCRRSSASCSRRTPRTASRRTACGILASGGDARIDKVARQEARRRRVAGAWLELSVEADLEAVEAVSEILVAWRPAGRASSRVRAGRRGAGRARRSGAAGHRPGVPAGLRPAAVDEPSAAVTTAALGHLQAFGLRPIGDVETRLVHEADWADAWKQHFPVLRVGRRLVIRPTWRRHRRRRRRRRPRPRPGDGVRDRAAPDDAALPRGARAARRPRRRRRGARVLDVGCGSGILAIAAVRLGAASALGVDTDPIAIEATPRTPAGTGSQGRIARARAALPTGEGPFDVVLANLIASLLVRLAPRSSARDSRRAARCSPRGSSSTARPRSATRSSAPACASRTGRGRATGSRSTRSAPADPAPASFGGSRPPDLQSRPMPTALFPFILVVHITLAISLFVPSILLPFTLRTRARHDRLAEPRDPLPAVDAEPRDDRHRARPGADRARDGRDPRSDAPPAAVAARRADDLLREPGDRVLHPAPEPAAARRHHGGARRHGSGRSGRSASATCRISWPGSSGRSGS